MRRILIIYPNKGLSDLVKQVLLGAYEVEGFEKYESAVNYLVANGVYEAVLCGLAEPTRTIEVFEKVAEALAHTRLIPIADSAAQVARFCDEWSADKGRYKTSRTIGQELLPEPCTAGEILALFPTVIERQPGETSLGESEKDGPVPMEGESEAAGRAPAQDIPNQNPLRCGMVVDGYRLVCLIGQGGFGVTWRAENETTAKPVAIKSVEGQEQVSQELAALRKYVHVAEGSENLIQVLHLNRDALRLWLVTPLADSLSGGDTPESYRPLSLANQLEARGHLSDQETVRVGIGIARALSTLHHAGLLHGDATPFNILRVHGRWVLADPGLVRFLGQPGITRDRTYYPDPRAMRPWDDLYALGLTIWDMASGRWEMASGKERLRPDQKMLDFVARRELPIGKFVCRALAENPEHRYMNAEAMMEDLEWVAAKLATDSRTQSSLYDLLRQLRGGLPPLA